jgi:hypothetical protein
MPSERDETLEHLRAAVPDIRKRRQPLENEWLLNHHCWRGQKTRWYFEGSTDHYIPAARRAIERNVTRARKQLIPTQEFFEVYPWSEAEPDADVRAENVRAYLLYVLVRHMKMRLWLDQIFRSYYLYGRSIVKNMIKFVDLPFMSQYPSGRPKPATSTQVWPFSRVVDPFAFYVWPETASTLDDFVLIFEDVLMPYEEYRSLSERPGSDIDEIPRGELLRAAWPPRHTQRLNIGGFVEPSATASGGEEKAQQGSEFVQLSECYLKRKAQWVRSWIVWNVVNGPKQTRYGVLAYPEPPYRFSFARTLPGEGYGTSIMSDLEPLNVWLNDEVNMTQEARLTAMFPPTLINPSAIFREESLIHRPRAKWFVDPSGVNMPSLPDTSRIGVDGVRSVMNILDSFSGSNPLAEGQPQRGMPRAGFAVSSLVSLSLADITAICEVIEDDILTPTLTDLHRLAVLFTPSDQLLSIPAVMGLNQRQLTPIDLYGDWTFRWVGSLQSQDFQVKAQRIVTFMGLLTKMVPALQQSGKQVQWDLLLRRVWREGLGERGAGTIIRDMTPQEAQFAQMMQAGLGAGGPRTNGGGSAPGGGQAPVPGQGMNPATAEQLQGGIARNLSESQIGQQLAGMGPGT